MNFVGFNIMLTKQTKDQRKEFNNTRWTPVVREAGSIYTMSDNRKIVLAKTFSIYWLQTNLCATYYVNKNVILNRNTVEKTCSVKHMHD